jgi:NAD(P)-dependent dehydrogenase (short-subunit alcohol dehydrogenase family)
MELQDKILNEEQGARAVAELGEDKALFATTDVTDEDSVARAIAATMDKFGAIHININCAGVPAPCKVLDREGRATALKKFVRGENGAQ